MPETSAQERYIIDWNESEKDDLSGFSEKKKLMTWFEALTGFVEESPEQVRANLLLEGEKLTSKVNGRTMICGHLETPSLAELRERVAAHQGGGKLKVAEAVGDVRNFHLDETNAGALFQVASQFNLLDMTLFGGGAFGNAARWIIDSVRHVLQRYECQDVEAIFVSYRGSSTMVRDILRVS